MVFKSVRNSLFDQVATCAFNALNLHVTQDHPAHIPWTFARALRPQGPAGHTRLAIVLEQLPYERDIMKIDIPPGVSLAEAELLLSGEAADWLTGDATGCEDVGAVVILSALQPGLDRAAVRSEDEGMQVDALAVPILNLDPHRQPVNRGRVAQFRQESHDLAELRRVHGQVKIAVWPGLLAYESIYGPASADTRPQSADPKSGQQIGCCFGIHDINVRTMPWPLASDHLIRSSGQVVKTVQARPRSGPLFQACRRMTGVV